MVGQEAMHTQRRTRRKALSTAMIAIIDDDDEVRVATENLVRSCTGLDAHILLGRGVPESRRA